MPRELLRTRGLGAGYGDLQVLWDVDIHLEERERVAVLGSNGAGKSTLLKTIAGLVRPMTGAILFDGVDITSMSVSERVKRGISLVPEGRRLFAGMTVRENLMMGAVVRSDVGEVARDLDWVLTLFPALSAKLRQVAGTLSGGEQQMCSIGRALMARPRLLLVDELSLGLSPALSASLLAAVMGLEAERTAIVLVEQDVLAALTHARRAYVLAAGRVSREGTSGDLVVDPMIKKSYLGD